MSITYKSSPEWGEIELADFQSAFKSNYVSNDEFNHYTQETTQKFDKYKYEFNQLQGLVDYIRRYSYTDHIMYCELLTARANVPVNLTECTLLVSPDGRAYWANDFPVILHEGIRMHMIREQFVKILSDEYEYENSNTKYIPYWQLYLMQKYNGFWDVRSSYRIRNMHPIDGMSAATAFIQKYEENDYPLFPFENPHMSRKEVEKICNKIFDNKLYREESKYNEASKSVYLYFMTRDTTGFLEEYNSDEYHKIPLGPANTSMVFD